MCKIFNFKTLTLKRNNIIYLLFLCFFFSSYTVLSQITILSYSTKINKDNNSWTSYYNSEGIKILYSYQQDTPTHGYKGEYIIFKVINNSKTSKNISWDFSAFDQDGICYNCDLNNKEVHFEMEIPAKHYVTGNPNNISKGPLTMFNRFTDAKYKGATVVGWKSFSLNNIIVK